MSSFDNSEFEKAKSEYRAEVEKRWGNTDAYTEHQKKTASYKKEDWQKIGEGMNAILDEFARAFELGANATGEHALALVKKLQDFITETQYTCTTEILAGLGEMYVADERFMKNINRHGEGTAEFMRDAIRTYCAIN